MRRAFMARVADVTLISGDEQYGFPSQAGDRVERLLKSLGMDTYNHRYVVRVTVDREDDSVAAATDDETDDTDN
jgi:hypothetical protein